MKIERKFKSIEEVKGFVSTMCMSYSMVLNQHLIEGDGKISVEHLTRIHEECVAYENQDPARNSCPYTFWIGIRTRGVESAENKESVKAKVAAVHDITLCAIKIERTGEDFTVSYRQRPLIAE